MDEKYYYMIREAHKIHDMLYTLCTDNAKLVKENKKLRKENERLKDEKNKDQQTRQDV